MFSFKLLIIYGADGSCFTYVCGFNIYYNSSATWWPSLELKLDNLTPDDTVDIFI